MNTSDRKIELGDTIYEDEQWAVLGTGGVVLARADDAEEAKALILDRMGCDWKRAHELGFRLARVVPSYKVVAMLVES